MRRICPFVIAGLAVCVAVPALVSGQTVTRGRTDMELTRVQLCGTLRYVPAQRNPEWAYATPAGYQIILSGTVYYLRFEPQSAHGLLAAKLNGKRVIVTGLLDHVMVPAVRRSNGKPVTLDATYFHERVIHVESLYPAAEDGILEIRSGAE